MVLESTSRSHNTLGSNPKQAKIKPHSVRKGARSYLINRTQKGGTRLAENRVSPIQLSSRECDVYVEGCYEYDLLPTLKSTDELRMTFASVRCQPDIAS